MHTTMTSATRCIAWHCAVYSTRNHKWLPCVCGIIVCWSIEIFGEPLREKFRLPCTKVTKQKQNSTRTHILKSYCSIRVHVKINNKNQIPTQRYRVDGNECAECALCMWSTIIKMCARTKKKFGIVSHCDYDAWRLTFLHIKPNSFIQLKSILMANRMKMPFHVWKRYICPIWFFCFDSFNWTILENYSSIM